MILPIGERQASDTSLASQLNLILYPRPGITHGANQPGLVIEIEHQYVAMAAPMVLKRLSWREQDNLHCQPDGNISSSGSATPTAGVSRNSSADKSTGTNQSAIQTSLQVPQVILLKPGQGLFGLEFGSMPAGRKISCSYSHWTPVV